MASHGDFSGFCSWEKLCWKKLFCYLLPSSIWCEVFCFNMPGLQLLLCTMLASCDEWMSPSPGVNPDWYGTGVWCWLHHTRIAVDFIFIFFYLEVTKHCPTFREVSSMTLAQTSLVIAGYGVPSGQKWLPLCRHSPEGTCCISSTGDSRVLLPCLSQLQEWFVEIMPHSQHGNILPGIPGASSMVQNDVTINTPDQGHLSSYLISM